jgi:hypothetical protein
MKRILQVLLCIAVGVLIAMCVISIKQGVEEKKAREAAMPQLIEDGNTTP